MKLGKPASAFFLVGTPAIYGSILAWITHQVRSGRHETVAWALCHLLTSVMVLFPVVVVLLNGFVFRSTTNRVAQLCAVHICWNAHTFTMMVMVWPFLLYKAHSGVGTYGEVLYDAACVDIFVVAPVVIATGYVKGVVSKRRRRFGWRHRAGLGLSCLFVFGCYLAGTSFARAATLEVALACAASFYLYTVGSYLPQTGQDKRAKFPTSKAPFSAVFHSFRLIFGRAIISWNGLEAWMLFPERARAEHSR